MKKYLFYIFAIMMACPAMAMSISGTVVDESGALPGANILLVDGDNVGTITDSNGKFTLDNSSITSQSKIQISYIGYKTQNLPAAANMGQITLETDEQQIPEVVVNANYDPRDCNETELNAVNATKGKTKINGTGGIICVPSKCIKGYELKDESCVKLTCDEPRQILNKAGTKCVDNDGECKSTAAHAAKAKNKYNASTKKLDCVITKCDKNYTPNSDGTACEQSAGPCSDDQIKAIKHAKSGELNKQRKCIPTECDDGFEPDSKSGTCVAVQEPEEEPESDEPKLSPEDQANKVAELQENYNNMKAKEQSAASRAAGTIGIGATGIGGMELASALAEQNADAASERDMAAYLATFVCDYGQGRFIKGGETDIELPGANALLPLRQEYVALATRLKTQKEALNLLPGIESEEIMDKATMGLYDNESLGKTDGAYTSLYRALTDETSADAAEWADQKSDTKTKLNTGIGLVGAGIVGSAAINLIGNKNAPKEHSAEINAEYAKKLQSIVADTATKASQLQSDKKCSDFTGATGEYPTCTCSDGNKQYFSTEEGCVSCEGDLFVVDGVCACPSDKPNQTGTSCAAPASNNCKLTKYVATGKCECIANATETNNTCECNSGFIYDEAQKACVAETVAPTTPDATAPATVAPTNQEIASFTIYSDAMFESGSAKIDNTKATALVTDFGKKLADAKTESTANADAIDNQQYCINITGHTDKVPFKKTASGMNNQKLSQQRADAIKDILTSQAGLSSENIHTSGVADRDCDKSGNQPDCRKVEVSLTAGACGAI